MDVVIEVVKMMFENRVGMVIVLKDGYSFDGILLECDVVCEFGC